MEGKHMMDDKEMGDTMKDKEMAKKRKKMMKRNSYSKDTVAMARGMMK